MAILSSDAFTGTDGVALPTYAAGRWASSPGDANLAIQTNTAGSGTSGNAGNVNIEVTWPPDHYTQATVVAIATFYHLVTVRHDPVINRTFYAGGHADEDTGDGRYRIIKYNNGAFSMMAVHASQTMQIGDVVKLEIIQLELVLYVNTIELLRVTDSVNVLWTGNSGIRAAHTASGLQIWDAYEGGSAMSSETGGGMRAATESFR